MTPVFTARRQADEFENALSGALDLASLTGRDAAALAPLLELVAEIRAVVPPAPRADYVADLRARLMAEADSVLLPVDTAAEARLRLPPPAPGVRRRQRRIAAVIGGAAVIGATASVAVAAQGALPGETLYPVKRAIENVRTDVTMDDRSKASMLLANAAGRLEEVDQVAREGSPSGVAALPGALDTFSSQATEAGELLLDDYRLTGRELSITELRDFDSSSMTMLVRIEGILPASSRDELLRAVRTIAVLDARAAALCPTCDGAGVTGIPTVLASAGSSGTVSMPTSLSGGALPRPTDVPRGDGADGDRGGQETGDRGDTGDTDDTGDASDPRVDTGDTGDTGDKTGDTGDKTGDKTGDTGDKTDTVPDPPAPPPTKPPGSTTEVGEDTAETATDVIDTITGTITGTTDDGVVGGVVDGVEDVLAGTGEVVDGTLGGLSGTLGGITGGLGGTLGGLTGGLTGGLGGRHP